MCNGGEGGGRRNGNGKDMFIATVKKIDFIVVMFRREMLIKMTEYDFQKAKRRIINFEEHSKQP